MAGPFPFGRRILNAGATAVEPVPTLPRVAVLTSDTLVDSFGVNTHPDYPDTAYNDARHTGTDTMTSLLQEAGIRWVRVGQPPYLNNEISRAHWAAMNGAGIKAAVVFKGNDPAPMLADLKANFPGVVRHFEGVNEPPGENYAAAYATQVAWYDAIRADPTWDSRKVWGPSAGFDWYGNAARPRAAAIDDGYNIHPYAAGQPPEGTLTYRRDDYTSRHGDRPFYASEWGMHTAINYGDAGFYGVSGEDLHHHVRLPGHTATKLYVPRTDGISVQAAYIVRGILEMFRTGMALNAVYQLTDNFPQQGNGASSAVADSGFHNMEQHYALVGVTGTQALNGTGWTLYRKASFHAVRRLLAWYADTSGPTAPTTWPVVLTGLSSNVDSGTHGVAAARRDGSLNVALWRAGVGSGKMQADNVWDDEATQRYSTSSMGAHLYPAAADVTINAGWPCRLDVTYPCRGDAVTTLGTGSSFTVTAPADAALYRLTRV